MPPSFNAPSATRCRRAVVHRGCALALLAVLASHVGCSVDDRTLTLEEGTSGSANTANMGGRAGARSGGAGGAHEPTAGADLGGQAGQAGQAGDREADGGEPSFADGCTDLDRDGISDCTETLLQNATFGTDVAHWTAETGATLAWSPLDLRNNAGSGSALVTSPEPIDGQGNALDAVFQCIPVHAGKTISVWANAQIAPETMSGGAEIDFWFFANDGCPGESPAVAATVAGETLLGKTVILKGEQAVPDYMVSMRVRLGVIKPFMAQSFSVRYDDVLVVEH